MIPYARFQFARLSSLRAGAMLFSLLFAATLCAAQEAGAPAVGTVERPLRISYRLAMPRPESHLFEVQLEVEGLEGADYIDVQMPRWSPGRYAIFDFAKNVQEVVAAERQTAPDAVAGKRASYSVKRIDTQTWRVTSGGASGLTLRYKVFGDDLSGTFSQLDARHANLNGASVFMYVVGHKQDPVRLQIEAPAGWRIVNGYAPQADGRTWEFPNYDTMIDTPAEIGPDWTAQEFQVEGKTYRVVIHAYGDDGGRRAALARDIEKIVRAEVAMWGAPDLESFTFIFHFDPAATRGDGMEHLTSTQIVETGVLADADIYESALETAAHEFFHVWNVKRLRPVELGPWDFTRPLATRSLWIAEGLTNYYGKMMLRRAGLWTDEQLLNSLGETISGIENSPGSRLMSAEEASLVAPFTDRATSEQRVNLGNTSVGYYPKGETLGLVLDLLIRSRSGGRASLDDVMRRMYEEFYVKSPKATYYLKGRGYTGEEFARVASEVAGADLSDFFARSVAGAEQPPYEEALASVGLRFVRAPSREPHAAGITVDARETQSVKIASVRNGSPAERAGLRQGDVLIQIGRAYVTTASWLSALNIFKQGSRVPVTVRRARETISATITLDAPDRYAYLIEKVPNPSAEAGRMRAAWLGGAK
jgi:predicted metalloprotease with PDZ domain